MADRKLAREVLEGLEDYAKRVSGKPTRGRLPSFVCPTPSMSAAFA